MPKSTNWKTESNSYFPFHITWPKNKTTLEMIHGISLLESMLAMTSNGNVGKAVIDPTLCEWSRLVTDLENNYTNIHMNGYGGQPRINRSGLHYMCSKINVHTNFITNSHSYERSLDNPPHISIIKIIIQHHEKN